MAEIELHEGGDDFELDEEGDRKLEVIFIFCKAYPL